MTSGSMSAASSLRFPSQWGQTNMSTGLDAEILARRARLHARARQASPHRWRGRSTGARRWERATAKRFRSTFELNRARRPAPLGRGRRMYNVPSSGQAAPAVRVGSSEGLGLGAPRVKLVHLVRVWIRTTALPADVPASMGF